MNPWIAYGIMVGPILVAPIYTWITFRKKGLQRVIRLMLWLILALHLVSAIPLAIDLPHLLSLSAGLFDDAMYGLVGVGYLAGVASAAIIVLGNAIGLWNYVTRTRRQEDTGK